MLRRSSSLWQRMLLLSESDVRQCLDLSRCLKVNAEALTAVYKETAHVPSRLGIPSGRSDWSLFKPASLNDSHLGLKVVSIREENPARNLPLVPASILHMNPTTGMVEAVVAGTYLTGARTSAGSALFIRHFCEHIPHLVMFGAGLQARLHLELIATAGVSVDHLTIVNRTLPRAEQLQEYSISNNLAKTVDITLLDSDLSEIISIANVICTTTNTLTPLFSGPVRDDCIITGIGSYTPDMQEVPTNVVNMCDVTIDTPGAVAVGDLKDATSTTNARLIGELLLERSSNSKRTKPQFYKAVGTAIQDVMTAADVVQSAEESQMGTTVDMD